MSIVQVNEKSGQSGSLTNEKGQREYSRAFQVLVDSPYDGPLQVRGANGIPRINDVYATSTENDFGCRVASVDCSQTDFPLLWEVNVKYSSDTKDAEKNQENPLERAAVISWSFQKYTKPAESDLEGEAITNTVGDAFDPVPEMDDSRPLLTITKNFASFDPMLTLDYTDGVNQDSFMGFEPETAKIQAINANQKTENDITYWEVKVEIEFRSFRTVRITQEDTVEVSGWDLAILNQGFNELLSEERLTMIDTKTGQAYSTPQLLDFNGTQLATGYLPVYVTAEIYRRVNFSDLNLI